MTAPLFPFQQEAIDRLVAGEPTYLGFDMGLGKSRTVIEAARSGAHRRILVLCPASAILVWKREISKWAPKASFKVVRKVEDFGTTTNFTIISHGLLSQRNGPVAEHLPKVFPAFDMTAIDEAHAFNAADSLRVKVLRRAAPRLGRIIPLSGTPMRNHAGDLYTLLSICWPEGLKTFSGTHMSRHQFEDLFCRVTLKNFGGSRLVRVIDGSKNIPQLRELMKPFMVRIRKEDVLKDLPPINWDTVPVDLDMGLMSPDDLDVLTTSVNNVINEATARAVDVDAALAGVNNNVHLMKLRRILGFAKLRGSLDYIVDMLDNLPPDRKILVFGVHTDVLKAIKHHLDEYDPAFITGETNPVQREQAVDKFLTKPQCRVFVGNIQAAGTALTLVGPTCKCADVVFVESSWTPADNAQAACRVHRIGQLDGVNARMLFADGTIDDLISDILVRKAGEFSQLFDGARP